MSPSPRRQSKLTVNLGEIFFVNLKSNLTSNIHKKPKQFLRRSRIWADSCRRRNAQVIQGKSHSFGRSPAALAGGKGYTCLCTYQWFAPGWGAGQSTGIRLCKARVGGDFDIHNGPQGGKFDSNFILFLFKHGKAIR